MTAKSSSDAALKDNYDVDYVIRYCFGGPGMIIFQNGNDNGNLRQL